MKECIHHEICHFDEDRPETGFCILHSPDPAKDKLAFRLALEKHRESSDNFSHVVFPGYIDISGEFKERAIFNYCDFLDKVNFNFAKFFGGVTFTRTTFRDEVFFDQANFNNVIYFYNTNFHKMVSFRQAVFNGIPYFSGTPFQEGVDFSFARFCQQPSFYNFKFKGKPDFNGAEFEKGANFNMTEFENGANFSEATFLKDAPFKGAIFKHDADFIRTKFVNSANFKGANFCGEAIFSGAAFSQGANFQESLFSGYEVDFSLCSFFGRTLFTSTRDKSNVVKAIFSGVNEVKFRQVIIDPPDGLIFIEADLSRSQFEDTNLQKIQLNNVIWPEIEKRLGVYEETSLRKGKSGPWGKIEQIYRQLKKNYEDNRDYERAGNFHYGEKEMRRKNPQTPKGLKFLLFAYRWVSGYGEKCLLPLYWTLALTVASSFAYLALGIKIKEMNQMLRFTMDDWLTAFLYSLEVIFLLKPDNLMPLGFWANLLHFLQSVFGPIFISLFVLAVRQKVKR